MKITITNTDVDTRKGDSKKTGKPYVMHTQGATAENNRFRMPIRLTLGDDGKAYPAGEYELDLEAAVQINQYGDVGFLRVLPLKLVKLAAVKAA